MDRCPCPSAMALLFTFLMYLVPASGQTADRGQQQMVDQARATLEAFAADPEMKRAFHELAPEVKALFILPDYFRWGFVVGGASGSGVLLVRDERTGQWSLPVFYNVGTLNLGAQVGANVSEIVVVIKSDRVVQDFYKASFKLGGSAGVAAGADGKAGAVHGITADAVAYARKTGLFAGISMGGAVVTIAEHANNTYYGQATTPQAIVEGQVRNEESLALRDAASALVQ